MFPVYGFGAKIPPNGHVSHMFPCNFQPQNPFVHGVAGVSQVYKACIPQIQLYGTTNFAPTIAECARMAKSSAGNNYFIILILTDGAITDMQQTINAIVDASYLPLSIIIIVVGHGFIYNGYRNFCIYAFFCRHMGCIVFSSSALHVKFYE